MNLKITKHIISKYWVIFIGLLICTKMATYGIFLILSVWAHIGCGYPQPKMNSPSDNMNGEYLISNPNNANGKSFSTLYSTYPNVEYFDAYSPPISTR